MKPTAPAPLGRSLFRLTLASALVCSTAAASLAQAGNLVTGTYSTGAAHAWTALPSVRLGGEQRGPVDVTIVVDTSRTRQHYTGMGFSLDETSVSNLWKLDPAQREAAIRLLVDPKTGAGFNRFRITIGTPDLVEHLPFFSYDEVPPGQEDFELKHFTIQRDVDHHILDVIHLIQRYNPHATFFASAWSAPGWMKTNDRFRGEVALRPGSSSSYYQVGRLRDDCIDALARYYVKFVQAYARQGVHVDAITLLNEPGIDVVYPAMDIPVEEQQKLALAIDREFREAGLDAQLYVHDFNFWDWKDPNSTATKNYYRIFEDSPDGAVKGAQVRAAADAIAFHPYWGDPAVMKEAYEEFGKPVHMTETSDLSPATVLDYLRLDASSYVLWAQTTDQHGGTLHWTPARDNHVDWDSVARVTKWPDRLVTVNTATRRFTVRDELYGLGQIARYLTPDFVRVESSATADSVRNVVFHDPAGHYVAVVGNAAPEPRAVRVVAGNRSFVETIPPRAYATLRWQE
ncbi:MAG TPA: glycoside hydrolase family 30 beta sandwich domain-containing protein [Longimicrobiaceae bacterium]|nr:glycoside hydrolase family 30 beta sandwich domain-containing protein [Longimicrobiaceae bacterium]